MTLNSEAKYSSGGGGEPRGSSISLLLTRQHFIGALFTKSKNYIIKRFVFCERKQKPRIKKE
jgi:hypothetical protein